MQRNSISSTHLARAEDDFSVCHVAGSESLTGRAQLELEARLALDPDMRRQPEQPLPGGIGSGESGGLNADGVHIDCVNRYVF